jgi:hypothetical protein
MLTPMPIKYVTGDATNPVGSGKRIIAHCCNDAGFWNAGFVRALSERFHQPDRDYCRWVQGLAPVPFRLGQIQFVRVQPGLCVANIIGQSAIRSASNPKPLRYDSLREGLARVRLLALEHDASLHMPELAPTLQGGDWQTISAIIEDELCSHRVNVTVYDRP